MKPEETTMMAAVGADRYGGPERLRVFESTPVPPGEGQVQIQVAAVSLNRSDLLVLRGEPFFMLLGNGLTRPRRGVPGSDVAGRVVEVGAGVDRFALGDPVVVDLSQHGRGGLAQRVTVDASLAVPVPEGVPLEAAAALPTAGVTALQALRAVAGIQAGERVLVDGASGGVGGFAIQIARALGGRVTAVVSRGKTAAARTLGADTVVDYTEIDPTAPGNDAYDVVYAVNGHRSLSDYLRILAPEGRFVMTGGSGGLMLQTILAGKRCRFLTMKPSPDDLSVLLEYLASGAITPNITARYPLRRAGEALSMLDRGHAAGKIIISVEEGETV